MEDRYKVYVGIASAISFSMVAMTFLIVRFSENNIAILVPIVISLTIMGAALGYAANGKSATAVGKGKKAAKSAA